MSSRNRVSEGYAYFITLTVVDWVDVFTRPNYKHIVIDSLKYCQENKGLEIWAWVLMSNHLHMVVKVADDKLLSDVIRDFKKFTNKKIIECIIQEPESRRDWLLYRFKYAGKYISNVQQYSFWQKGYEAKEIHGNDFLEQKIEYIHQNPVRAEIVIEPQHYLYSSAINYADGVGLLDVIKV